MTNKNLGAYFIIAFLVFLVFFDTCSNKKETVKEVTKSDTVYIDRVIKIPEIKEKITYLKPKEIVKNIVGKDTLRNYKKLYKDSTGVAEVEVFDSINGKLLQQQVNIKVKEREVVYKDKIITNTTTIKYKPSFVISAGLNTSISVNPAVGVDLMLKNREGWNLNVGYNTNKEIMIGLKKDLITFYKK